MKTISKQNNILWFINDMIYVDNIKDLCAVCNFFSYNTLTITRISNYSILLTRVIKKYITINYRQIYNVHFYG